MSHVLIAKLIESLGTALTEAVVSPEFIKTLPTASLHALYDLIRSEAFDRDVKLNDSNLLSPVVNTMTPEAQLAALREQFGDNGQKQLGVQVGHLEPMVPPSLDEVDYPFEIVRNELRHWVLNITDPVMNSNALMLMTEHFRKNGIVDGYRLGDVYYFYVEKDMVHFHNRTTTTLYSLNTSLDTFSQWYTQSAALIEQRMSEFLGK